MKLLYILPSIHGDLRQHCLETLASRADSFEEPNSIFVELKGMGLDASINHRFESFISFLFVEFCFLLLLFCC